MIDQRCSTTLAGPGAGARGDGPDEAGAARAGADPSALSMAELVQRLHGGAVEAESLDADLRRQCVAHLTLEGFSASHIAELMRMHERTVRRDRAAARQEGALEPSLTLGDELLGEFQQFTLASVQRLTRLAQDPSTPAYARLWAEEAIARVYERFIRAVKGLGYVESGEQRLKYLRQTDPAEQRRRREGLDAMLRAGSRPV